MASLASFMKEARSGKMYLELVERYGVTEGNLPPDKTGPRAVVKVRTHGVELLGPGNKVSTLPLERASLVEYDNGILCVYNPAFRELTEEEIAYKVKIEAQIKARNLMNDSAEFWLRRKYYEADGYGYLQGIPTKGKSYLGTFWSGGKQYVTDEREKGKLILKYRVSFWR